MDRLVTQPYDKIYPEMQARYLNLSPHNFVRIILGERFPNDNETNNVYTRSAQYLNDWIRSGILEQDREPGFYAYHQEFCLPDSEERLLRKGFIGLGAVEDYSAKIVHRHEQTLTGPKKDRMELLKATGAHLEQIFLLYSDPELAIDRILDAVSQGTPDAVVTDEYQATHRVWRISDPALVAQIQKLMADKKLLIADGHHRYETALAFRDANPGVEDARNMMMTFINMNAPGVRILATHRVVQGLGEFDSVRFFEQVPARKLGSLAELKQIFAQPAPHQVRIGIALPSGEVRLMDRDRQPGELDVKVLHEELLGKALGVTEEAVRDEKHLQYVRGLDAARGKVMGGEAQVAFLLEPTTIQQVADVAFGGGVMPQKSTDFFPKLLSGLTIYKLRR